MAAVLGTAAVTGCTALLGSFDASGGAGGGPVLPDGESPDGAIGTGSDGSSLDGSVDATKPVVCKDPEVACNNVCARLGTSGDHCGKCGHSCGGGMCTGGVCAPVQLYSGAGVVGAIAVSDADLFFATDDMKLSSCPKSGCKLAPKQIAVMGYSINTVAVVQKATVVFESAPTQSTQRPALYACPVSGCPSPPVSFTADGLNGFDQQLSVFGDRVFFNTGGFGLGWSTCQAGTCTAANRYGGTTKGVHAFSAAATRSYFVDSATRLSPIASCDHKDTACVPTPLLVGDNADVPATAVEGTRLFWLKPGRLDFNEGKLLSCDIPTCVPPAKVSAVGLDSPTELLVDASGAYWLTKGSKLQRCLPNGCVGGPTDFAGPLDVPHSIVADDAFVYWAEKTSVWRRAK